MVNRMTGDKKVFTLEKHKFASMGPDYVIIIPRKLIKYKVLDPEKKYHIHFEESSEEDQENSD